MAVHMVGMWNEKPVQPVFGFTLLEVVVAIAILGIGLLGLGIVLGAAVERAAAAASVGTSLQAVAAIAETSTNDSSYPGGWRLVGTVGADGLPGTVDDRLPPPDRPPCWRRVTAIDAPLMRWFWIEATCDIAFTADRGRAVDSTPPTGELVRGIQLLVAR